MVQILMLILLGFQLLQGGAQEQKARTNTEDELNLTLIGERIAKNSAEGLAVIERVKQARPQIQKYQAVKSLGAIVEDYSSGRGPFMIYPVGWEALEGLAGRWVVSLYYKDEAQKYVKASWEYNKNKQVLFPAEIDQATKFWAKGAQMNNKP